MPRKKSRGFTQPMTSMEYFNVGTEDSVPIKAISRRCTVKTALRQNELTTLIFIKNGSGSILVNAEEYELHRGVLMAISDYQSYKIKPTNGETLEYVECQLDYMLYLYFMANPYFKFTSPGLGPCAVYSVVEGENLKTAERLTDYLVTSRSKSNHGEREVLQIMELFGMLIKYSDAEEKYPIPVAPEKPTREESSHG